ncbi:helix-turn-helix domain-containing protein [Nonomuraea sp. CA-143628]|uniref:helix-turn-helix domain-containing protein n=1 Tax=Nonomuraea sp. CA-143628 TaxID=3239997 RepID=UPI003D94B2D1
MAARTMEWITPEGELVPVPFSADRLTEALAKKGLTDRGAARALKRQGTPMSHEYVGKLKKGEAANPSLDKVEALARLLEVTVGWLAGDPPEQEKAKQSLSAEEQAQIDRVRQGMSELRVQNIAERMTGLTEELSLDAVEQIVNTMLAAERRMQPEDYEM